MTGEEQQQQLVSNAVNWLRLLFHAITCRKGHACELGERCQEAKKLLAHMLCCQEHDRCAHCASVRKLMLHYLTCSVRK